MRYDSTLIEQLKKDIAQYESEASQGFAQHFDTKLLFKKIRTTMENIGLDYCTINLIKLGSERYKKYEKDFDCSRWIMIKREEN
jgi:hypothetical protein